MSTYNPPMMYDVIRWITHAGPASEPADVMEIRVASFLTRAAAARYCKLLADGIPADLHDRFGFTVRDGKPDTTVKRPVPKVEPTPF